MIDIEVYIKNRILYIDYGYVRVGDIYKLMDKLDTLIDELPKPFQTISLYERAIAQNSLPAPDDSGGIQAFADFMETHGRDLSVWVLPGDNILFRSLHNIANKRDAIAVAKTVEDAEEIILAHRDIFQN